MKGTHLDVNQAAILRRRLATIDDLLASKGEHDIEKIATITAMIDEYASRSGWVSESSLVSARKALSADNGYLFAVREFPAWAVSDACALVLAGKVDFLDGKFCPGPFDLEKVCRVVVRKLTRERTGIYKAFEAVP